MISILVFNINGVYIITKGEGQQNKKPLLNGRAKMEYIISLL